MCRSCGCKTPAVRQVDNQGELAVSVCALCLVSLLTWQQVGSFYVSSRFIGALILPPPVRTHRQLQSKAELPACRPLASANFHIFSAFRCFRCFIFSSCVALLFFRACQVSSPSSVAPPRDASMKAEKATGPCSLRLLKPLFVCLQAVQIHVGVTQ